LSSPEASHVLDDSPLYRVAATMVQELAANERVYLLADQSGLPQITSIWPYVRRERWVSVLGMAHGQPDGGTPLLIELAGLVSLRVPRGLLDQFYRHGRFANCLSLLCSELPLVELARALKQRTEAELPDRLPVVLRYFDTRTLPLLQKLLHPDQYASFMSCVRSWLYVDRCGQVQTMASASEDCSSTAFVPPLLFDTRQERMLIDDGTVDAVIDQLIEQHHPVMLSATPPEQFDVVCGPAQAAAAFGISEVHDVMLFCCTALEHGAGFEQSNPWAQRLAQYQRGSMTLQEALTHAA